MRRFVYDWRGVPQAPVRAPGLGDVGFADSQNPGTAYDGLYESQYRLGKGSGPFFAMHPWNGAPEPLSPQAYPAWQSAQLGFWDGLSDNAKMATVVLAGGVTAWLLFGRRPRRRRRRRYGN